jgi:hypothetical protein
MATYSEYAQRMLDIKSGKELDRINERKRMAEEHIIYMIDESQMKRLRFIEMALYGTGTPVTPDARRDLANNLNLVLNEIRDFGKVPHQKPRK